MSNIRLAKVYGLDTLIDPATEKLLLNDFLQSAKNGQCQKQREQLQDFIMNVRAIEYVRRRFFGSESISTGSDQ